MEISLKLNNEDDLLNLTDLLLPLNYFNNFIYELENLKILDERFENESNIKMLNNENIFRHQSSQTIKRRKGYVEIRTIQKKSPAFFELFLLVAPYVEETIKILVENKDINIEEKLYNLLNEIESFKNLSESKKRAIIRYILLFFRLLLGYFTITINR